MISIRYQALGLARRFVVPPSGGLSVEEPFSAGDLMSTLGIDAETAVRAIVDGNPVPLDAPLSDGTSVILVVLVTAG